eukprot:1130698-Rhodomonas_salina.2
MATRSALSSILSWRMRRADRKHRRHPARVEARRLLGQRRPARLPPGIDAGPRRRALARGISDSADDLWSGGFLSSLLRGVIGIAGFEVLSWKEVREEWDGGVSLRRTAYRPIIFTAKAV